MLLDNDTQDANVSEAASMSVDDQFGVSLLEGAIIGAVNLLLSIIGTFGNFLIIFAIWKTPQLRQRPSNFLLLSLAVADLVMTIVAQPLFAAYVLLGSLDNRCIPAVDMTYFFVTILSGGSSINHLAAISFDRALAIVKPHKHHDIMKKGYKVMLFLCWGIVVMRFIKLLIIQITRAGKIAALIGNIYIITFIAIKFLLMIGSYTIILYRIKCPKIQPTTAAMPSEARNGAMERRVSGTIAIVILLFAATWLPNVGYKISHPDTTSRCSFDVTLLWICTLFLANSSMNFIVYSLRIRQFRTAYLRIINRMLQSFRDVVGKCFRTTPKPQNIVVTQVGVAPVSTTIQI